MFCKLLLWFHLYTFLYKRLIIHLNAWEAGVLERSIIIVLDKAKFKFDAFNSVYLFFIKEREYKTLHYLELTPHTIFMFFFFFFPVWRYNTSWTQHMKPPNSSCISGKAVLIWDVPISPQWTWCSFSSSLVNQKQKYFPQFH